MSFIWGSISFLLGDIGYIVSPTLWDLTALLYSRAGPAAEATSRICAPESPPITAGLGGGYFSVSTMCSVQAYSCTLEVQWVAFLGARSEVGPSGSMSCRYGLHGPAWSILGCGALCLLLR